MGRHRGIASGVNSVQALAACLRRIRTLNPGLNAFLFVDEPGAAAAAQASLARHRRGAALSPVDGMPIGVKANIAVQGMPWHGGIGAYRDRIARQDAACVAALRKAGAVIIGILNMHEAGLGGTSDNPFFGAVRNPGWPGLSPGGSSGGGASAVAARLCHAALGTDTLGSVRIPAAYCGVFGHKPAAGLVSTTRVMPLSRTLDSVGVQAPDARTCAAVLAALAPGLAAPEPAPITCAVLDVTGQVDLDPVVAVALRAATAFARECGLSIETIRLPDYPFAAMRRLGLLIAEVEAAVTHRASLASDPAGFSAELRGLLAWGATQPAAKIAAAHEKIAAAAGQVRSALAGVDILLLPTTPRPPFAVGAAPPADQADLTALANLTGLAATAFPAGLSPAGAPLSLQALGASDHLTLHVAGLLQRH
jgi:aspartyl-tRNA(Asn)/glutamyl-tRNA(Gln) amidotransferase subunit A